MKSLNKQALFSPILFCGLFGCVMSSAKEDTNSGVRPLAAESAKSPAVKAEDFTEIAFDLNSAQLNDTAKDALNQVVSSAKRYGKIEEVIVLTWADQDYPSIHLKHLPRKQVDLASKRNAAIEKYLGTLIPSVVNTYNMAQHPDALSKWFDTPDFQLKMSLISAGLPTTDDAPSSEYTKASHSVILIRIL